MVCRWCRYAYKSRPSIHRCKLNTGCTYRMEWIPILPWCIHRHWYGIHRDNCRLLRSHNSKCTESTSWYRSRFPIAQSWCDHWRNSTHHEPNNYHNIVARVDSKSGSSRILHWHYPSRNLPVSLVPWHMYLVEVSCSYCGLHQDESV